MPTASLRSQLKSLSRTLGNQVRGREIVGVGGYISQPVYSFRSSVLLKSECVGIQRKAKYLCVCAVRLPGVRVEQPPAPQLEGPYAQQQAGQGIETTR